MPFQDLSGYFRYLNSELESPIVLLRVNHA
jgi:hypothetical protein